LLLVFNILIFSLAGITLMIIGLCLSDKPKEQDYYNYNQKKDSI
jgi:hypothetical protein